MAEKTVEKVVYHALFEYKDEATGTTQLAFKGDTIHVNATDAARGEKFGAFVTEGQRSGADLFPGSASLEERATWLSGHTVEQAIESLRTDRSLVPSMLEAEESRGQHARTTLLQVLANASQQ